MIGKRSDGPSRRRIWNIFAIEESFQQRQILRLLLLTAMNVVVSTVAFIALQRHDYVLQWGAMSAGPGLDLMRMAISWAALMGGLGGLFALCMGLLMTHRMAGPIHHFKQELLRLADGEAPRLITVRDDDEFADFASALNRALQTLTTRAPSRDAAALSHELEQVRAAHGEILAGIEALDCDALPSETRTLVESWRTQMNALREKLQSNSASA